MPGLFFGGSMLSWFVRVVTGMANDDAMFLMYSFTNPAIKCKLCLHLDIVHSEISACAFSSGWKITERHVVLWTKQTVVSMHS